MPDNCKEMDLPIYSYFKVIIEHNFVFKIEHKYC